MHYDSTGTRFYHPYYYTQNLPFSVRNYSGRKGSMGLTEGIAAYTGGKWVDLPHVAVKRAFKGGNLATTIAQGNFMTRNFRQKPIVGLQTATHTRVQKSIPAKVVEIQGVTSRRTKDYSKINLLTTNKAMPFKRSYKRPSRVKRPRFGKRKTYRRRRRIPTTIPHHRVMKFKMVHSTPGLGPANGNLTKWDIKANSLNDPLGPAGAGLPLGLDQWAAMYSKYIVLGSRVKLRLHRSGGTGAGVIGLHLSDNTTSLADHDYYRETSRTKNVILDDEKPTKYLSMSYSGKKFWKVTNLKDDSEQEGAFSVAPGDPTDVAYWHLYLQDLSKAEAFAVEAQITIEWIVMLTNPIIPTRSSL